MWKYYLLRWLFRQRLPRLGIHPSPASILKKANRIISLSSGYQRFLEEEGIAYPLSSYKDFLSLPVLEKERLVRIGEMAFVLPGYKNHPIPLSLIPSSGAGGLFSFGVLARRELDYAELQQDLLLDLFFDVVRIPTLIINTLSMGIFLTSSLCSVINTSVREDTAIEVARRFGKHFGQIILIGDNTFVKNLLEMGFREALEGADLKLIIGEEPFPESFRLYLERTFGIKEVFSSFGMAELGLNVCFETPFTVQVRREIIRREENFGYGFYPMVFQYSPQLFFMEELGSRLAISTLFDTAMPLLRYGGEEIVRLMSYEEAVARYGIEDKLLRWPLCLLWGKPRYLEVGGESLSVEEVKDLLYSAEGLPHRCTGAFKMKRGLDGIEIFFQLKTDTIKGDLSLYARTLADTIRLKKRIKANIHFVPFKDYPQWDYERKLRYLE